jgi:hypothetical protein
MEPIRLVMAAAFAYTAKLPMYVFHSEAGVFGRTRFQDMPGIDRFHPVLRLLPPDVANWRRNDGKEVNAPFTSFAGGKANRYWPDVDSGADGCVRNIGGRKGSQFVCVPIGIQQGGLVLEARKSVHFSVYDPLTGRRVRSAACRAGERCVLPQGPGAYILLGTENRSASLR